MRKNLRIMVAILALVMALTACQPTPESEPVVNKGDRVLEEKITAVAPTQNPAEAEGEATATAAPVFQYTFPEKWEEVYDAGNDLVLTFDADIIQKEDGVYPVYRTKAGTVDAEMVQKIAEALLPAPVSYHSIEKTKNDWKKEMENYLKQVEESWARLRLPPEERGDGDDTLITQEEVDEQLEWYAEQIAEAPDAQAEVEVTDYSQISVGESRVYQLSDGDIACISVWKTSLVISRGISGTGYVSPEYMREVDEDDGLMWKEPTITQEYALKQGRETLDKLGLEGFVAASVYKANYRINGGMKIPLSAGYTIRYMRDYGGYPLLTNVQPDENLNYGSDDSYSVNTSFDMEFVDMYVDEMGVRYICYHGPREVLKEENPAVELQDFETIQERARKALTYGLTGKITKVEIYKMVLTVNTQRVVDSDEYYEVPCWVLYLDKMGYSWCKTEEELQAEKERYRNDPGRTVSALYINAIDGTVIHVDYGW